MAPPKQYDWDSVDWSQEARAIAERLGCSATTVRNARRSRNMLAPMTARRRPPPKVTATPRQAQKVALIVAAAREEGRLTRKSAAFAVGDHDSDGWHPRYLTLCELAADALGWIKLETWLHEWAPPGTQPPPPFRRRYVRTRNEGMDP